MLLAILTFVYGQKKCTTHKGSSQKTHRPKILANILEEIESCCVYTEQIKRAVSHNPLNVIEAGSILAEMVKNGISLGTVSYNAMGQITQENLPLDLITYNCLLHTYATAKPAHISEAEKLTDHLEKEIL